MSETLEQPSLLRLFFVTPAPRALPQLYRWRPVWRLRLRAAELPVELRELIFRVVKRTRLWQREKLVVADELIAHFTDALASGKPTSAAIESFGDEAVAAKLIRRAKRRNRSIAWRIRIWLYRGFVGAIAIYGLLLARFCLERPHPTIDYVAQLNASALATPVDDRAWPLWRKAIEGMVERTQPGHTPAYDTPAWLEDTYSEGDWPTITSWLDQHQASLAIAREAGLKPNWGYIYGSKSDESPMYSFPTSVPTTGSGLEAARAATDASLTFLGRVAEALAFDASLAGHRGESDRTMADVRAMLGLAAQLRGRGQFFVVQLMGVNIDDEAVRRIGFILRYDPEAFSDAQWIELAHWLAGPQVAGDMVNLSVERIPFDNLLEQTFTNDGNGGGHITKDGVEKMLRTSDAWYQRPTGNFPSMDAVMSGAPVLTLSRDQARSAFDDLLRESIANFQVPIRDANWSAVVQQVQGMRRDSLSTIRNLPVVWCACLYSGAQAQIERYLGHRDGLEVGIALEIYHRHPHAYPATLDALVPQYLPAIPADRITGNPVKYRLINGEPVIYSVGADRTDDGGHSPLDKDCRLPYSLVPDNWDHVPSKPYDGDWVLYPPFELPFQSLAK